jgi:hypothetical protein
MNKPEPTTQSYTLFDETGGWLGQILLTSDGMFAAVTDWGNITFAWRSYSGTFKEFMLHINTEYFAGKMRLGILDFSERNKNTEHRCKLFAEKILPALQKVLKEEIMNQK